MTQTPADPELLITTTVTEDKDTFVFSVQYMWTRKQWMTDCVQSQYSCVTRRTFCGTKSKNKTETLTFKLSMFTLCPSHGAVCHLHVKASSWFLGAWEDLCSVTTDNRGVMLMHKWRRQWFDLQKKWNYIVTSVKLKWKKMSGMWYFKSMTDENAWRSFSCVRRLILEDNCNVRILVRQRSNREQHCVKRHSFEWDHHGALWR